MSSFDRRSLLMIPLALAACGFEPVYAPGGTASGLDGKVRVSAPNSVESYLLVQNLEQRLGRHAGSGDEYKLNVNVSTVTQPLAVSTANEINRYNILGRVNFSLQSSATGAVLASGEVDNFVSYSAAGSTVDTLADERDAKDRLMVLLADQVLARLYSTVDLPA
ncbi:hypothetical protein FGK63_17580 [Ruegeria sediminis]|uniref:LPS-assembly lipoprotein n=1 Tax=Ruegeria sediminis TaxID=2583820 RepID=A0ABY2WUB3_9RHOB|nr:LPS assembly lipoprotein LptE [Ruegeria sediminis]TMV04890.1 hypothetical protein FGK63_17580 [Ruegeria sediminis]